MTVHFVYPYDPEKIAAPWTIGNNLTWKMQKAGLEVKNYNWDSFDDITPLPGDILLGHPHPEMNRVFNRNFHKNFKKVISLCPWNGLPEWEAQLAPIVPECDAAFFICADYWQQRTPSWFSGKCLDMAISQKIFKQKKFKFNAPGRRQFLFLSCTVENKNPGMLTEIKKRFPAFACAHFGFGHVEGIENFGHFDPVIGLPSFEAFQAHLPYYDFVVMTSKNDANPTVILEAMAYGLIPICTPQCGWGEEDALHIPLDDIDEATSIIYDLSLRTKDHELNYRQNHYLQRKKLYTWDRFCTPIIEEILK